MEYPVPGGLAPSRPAGVLLQDATNAALRRLLDPISQEDGVNKFVMSVLIALMMAGGASASETLAGVNVGLYNPEATDSGLLISGMAGMEIDERIDVTFTLDWYRKTFEENTAVYQDDNQGGTDIGIVVPNFESSVTMIPLMANVKLKIPLDGAIDAPLVPYLKGGLGYILTWYGYDNYDTDENETQFYGGFGLRLGIGGMYQIGSNSRVTLEVFYQSSSLEREEEDPEIGRPVVSELDMSGLGVTVGLQFGGMRLK